MDGVRKIKRALLIVLGVILAVALYGVMVEPRLLLDVEEEEVFLPRLPRAWEGQTIAAIGDFQLGMWLANKNLARRAVRELVERRPAAVLLLGDFLYKPEGDALEQARLAADILRPLTAAGIPTFAVLGNHDLGLYKPGDAPAPEAAEVIREALREIGVEMLHNEAAKVQAPGGGPPLYIVGIGPAWPELDRPEKALREVPEGAARVVMMHNPESFAEIPAGDAPLAVAGHTHGGQVRIPFMPKWSWLTYVRQDEVHADGWILGYGAPGNQLYVNRGIGMSVVPMRINCLPEVTVFTVRRAAGSIAGNVP